MIGIRQLERRAASRAISGVDDVEFTLNLMGRVFEVRDQPHAPAKTVERRVRLEATANLTLGSGETALRSSHAWFATSPGA
jgi:hypothetical protein